MEQNILVFSAHAADYVWRAGGTIAKYVENGARVKLVILSLGIRGESNDLWKTEGQTAEQVARIRREETTKAAEILGLTDVEFWDLEDYPITITRELEERAVRTIRTVRPDVILTHDQYDILNPDHNLIHDFVFRCSVMSNSSGVITPGLSPTKQMRIYCFEPHQTELSNYTPSCFIDVTDTAEKKIQAMQCFQAQKHLITYYTDRLAMRGNHARRLSGLQDCQYAESFSAVFPSVRQFF